MYRSTENQPNNFISSAFIAARPDLLLWRTWFFVVSNFNQLYRNEERNIRIITWFSVGAIVIASVGLLGLIGFTISQKQKEIGIRKVLGASDAGIVIMLNREFVLKRYGDGDEYQTSAEQEEYPLMAMGIVFTCDSFVTSAISG